MVLEKFPLSSEIAWSQIKEVRVSSDKDAQSYSFEFDLGSKKEKMTISIGPKSTSYTLSAEDGTPIVHATQEKGEVKVIDFSIRPKLPPWLKKLQKESG